MRVVFLVFSILSLAYAQPSCEALQADKGLFFKAKSLPLDCPFSLREQKATAKLYILANAIRGGSSTCSGSKYFESLKNFDELLLKIALLPREYQKSLADAEQREAISNKNKAYFRFWAYQSIGNYTLFTQFWENYNNALMPLTAYFERRFDKASAIFYATNALNEFLNYAVGNSKLNKDISTLAKLVTNKNNDLAKIKEYIFIYKPSLARLNSAFYAALLKNRNLNIIKYFVNFGISLNQGYESALFYSLNSYENTKYLLSKGALVNYANAFGKSALFYAVELNLYDIAKLLLENGADANKQLINESEKLALANGASMPYFITLCALEHSLKSVLMSAAAYSDVAMIKLLLKHGAKLDLRDDLGYNALDFALLAKKQANAKYLKELGLKASF